MIYFIRQHLASTTLCITHTDKKPRGPKKRKLFSSVSRVHEIKSEDPAKEELVEVKEEHEEIAETPPQRRKRRRVVVKQDAEESGSALVKKEDGCGGSNGGSKSGDALGKQNRKRNRRPAANELVIPIRTPTWNFCTKSQCL